MSARSDGGETLCERFRFVGVHPDGSSRLCECGLKYDEHRPEARGPVLSIESPEPGVFGPLACGCVLQLHVWDPCGPLLPILDGKCGGAHGVADFDGAPARFLLRPVPGWKPVQL